MATIEITIPDAKLTLLLNSIANQYGWVEEPDEADPEWDPDMVYLTKAQFAKQATFNWWKGIVRRDLANQQHDAGTVIVDTEMATW